MLSLDYLKRTFHGFTPDTTGETPELIWWSVFAGEQQKFIRACRNIIERPRHRLQGYEVFLRADKLKCVPANIENELAEHRREQAYLYRVEEQIQSNDTQENRFLKYALGQIIEKYESLKERIESINGLAVEKKKELAEIQATLKHLQRKRKRCLKTIRSFILKPLKREYRSLTATDTGSLRRIKMVTKPICPLSKLGVMVKPQLFTQKKCT